MGGAVGVVVSQLRARREEIVQAILARVREVAPDPLALGDAEYVAGLHAAVASAVDYGLTGIERAEEAAEPVPRAALAQARRAARGGVSIETVLLRYTAGYALLEGFVLEEAERSGLPGRRGTLRQVLRAHAAVFERLTTAIAEEHRCELTRVERSPGQRQLEHVRSLLGGGPAREADDGSPPGSLEQGLGYALDCEHLAVIARGALAREPLRELAARLDRRLLSVAQGEETIWAWLGGQRRLEMRELKRVVSGGGLDVDVSLAVGEPARGLAGWRQTHRQAQAALLVALRRPQQLTCYADVALLAAALKDEALAQALIDIYIVPLEEAHSGSRVLRETLGAYLLAECNASSTAAALGVVRKTVENRLRTIEERLGRSLHPCPAELEVALSLDALGAPDALEISMIR
jgi:hypothetical protein